MVSIKNLALLALSTLAAASPMEPRSEKEGTVKVFGGTTCGDLANTYSWMGSGTTSQCWKVTDIGSYQAVDNGCKTSFWGNGDCTGQKWTAKNSDCNSLEFASLSIKC
ncbi:hypothetical protein M406DRAFT_329082 [Cryphonectria parasitica EP155]|uniref:Uncharacterized protein n=1 Tax=Cryphonectria parasitica (strain ATCC 38755 / EP155) TaxID=660469 RepID=A0A9P4Y6X4_CRYP1|nr:uncharacterized protein M406DRAFT_329082 [Cryphonectria parasitica EP155]KAF3768037.1 hypothetical protein M406DRAFT_329082 [Cryphonectria parasitica EP155]